MPKNTEKVFGRPVEKVIKWKIYFDARTGKPVAPNANAFKIKCPGCKLTFSLPRIIKNFFMNFLIIADTDQKLPTLENKPLEIEEREVAMFILKNKTKGH